MIEKDLIFLDIDIPDQNACFSFLAEKLLEKKYVKSSFLEALYQREKDFPTGLEFIEGYGVAIPHVEKEHCLKDTVSFLRPLKPISFRDMETGETLISTRYIFMLTITDPNKQIDLLQSLFAIISNESFLKTVGDKDQGIDSLENYINSMLTKS